MSILILFIILITVFIILRKVYEKLWMKNLGVSVKFTSDNATEGEKAFIVEEVENNKNLFIPNLEIDFQFDKHIRFSDTENSMVSDKLYRRDVFSLGSKKRIIRKLEINCDKRGYYTIKKLGLMTNDLFMTKKYFGSALSFTEMYVLPRLVPLSKLNIPFNRIMGEVLSRQRVYEDPMEFGGIRDYRQGDPMKQINWKASAKTGNMLVNFYDSTVLGSASVILDCYDSLTPIDDELNEEAIRIASALCEKLMLSGIKLDLHTNGSDIISGKNISVLDMAGRNSMPLKRQFARLDNKNSPESFELINSITNCKGKLIIFISKNKSTKLIESCNQLSMGNTLVWIMPYKGEEPTRGNINNKTNLVLWEYKGVKL